MREIMIGNCNPNLYDIQENISTNYDAKVVSSPDELERAIKNTSANYIFFLHWSWIIPEYIYNKVTCIVFHMTDLPYGRGGSPLQNLIVRGVKHTKLTAIKVDGGLDTGPIFLKRDLSLEGTATEIFKRSGLLMEQMIGEILNNHVNPKPQSGEATIFKRRMPSQSSIPNNVDTIEKLYDFIRMLDADNYPKAFIENENFKIEFFGAEPINDKELIANVKVTRK